MPVQSTQTRNKSNSLLQQQQQQLQEKALKIKSKIQVCSIVATITQTAANRNELSRKSLTAVGVPHNKSNAHALYANALSSANRKLPSGNVLKLLPTFACYSILPAFQAAKLLPTFALCFIWLPARINKSVAYLCGHYIRNSLELFINP